MKTALVCGAGGFIGNHMVSRLKQEGYLEVFFRSGWRVLPFDFKKFEQLYELRQILETAAVQSLCHQDSDPLHQVLQELQSIWLVPTQQRSLDGEQVRQWDESFHCALVQAAGNDEMSRIHGEITEKIRMIRRLDFTQADRIQATYDEHAQILKAILGGRAEQANMLLRAHISASQSEVRKITVHQLQTAQEWARSNGIEQA